MAHKPYEFVPPKPPTWFNLFWPGLLGLLVGFLTATGQKDLMLLYAILGAIVFSSIALICVKIYKELELLAEKANQLPNFHLV